jgi:hypothetical protein
LRLKSKSYTIGKTSEEEEVAQTELSGAEAVSFDAQEACSLGSLATAGTGLGAGGSGGQVLAETRQGIVDQLDASFEGYLKFIHSLNGDRFKDTFDRDKQRRMKDGLAEQLEVRLTADAVGYVAQQQASSDEMFFTLAMTPNAEVAPNQLSASMYRFGRRPFLRPAYIQESLFGEYTPRQLNQPNPRSDYPVKMCLFPSMFTDGMHGKLEFSRRRLNEKRAVHSFLRVASVAEAISNLYVLAEDWEDLCEGDVYELTANRHINLEEKPYGSENKMAVLCTGIRRNGEPGIRRSLKQEKDGTRLVVAL